MNKNISSIFKNTRKSYGKSQAEFAKLLGCSRVSISLYETGKSEPGSDKYAKVLMLNEAISNKGRGAISRKAEVDTAQSRKSTF